MHGASVSPSISRRGQNTRGRLLCAFRLVSLFTLSGEQANAEHVFWFRIVKAYQQVGPIYLILAVVLIEY